jgi:hypothetical protein
LSVFCKAQNIVEAGAIDSVNQNLEDQKLIVENQGSFIIINGTKNDVKGKITTMTGELLKRTEDLNKTLITQSAVVKT